jgi:hypothetical protein
MLLTQGQSLSKAFPTTDRARMFSFTPEIAQGLPVRMDIIETINQKRLNKELLPNVVPNFLKHSVFSTKQEFGVF